MKDSFRFTLYHVYTYIHLIAFRLSVRKNCAIEFSFLITSLISDSWIYNEVGHGSRYKFFSSMYFAM